MVKFGKPEATWKMREEERILAESVGEGRYSRRQRVREKGKGKKATREVSREGYGWTESSEERTGRKIRDKETNIDNEKTSMAKKEAGRWSGRRR